MLLHDTVHRVHSSGILNSYANTNEVGENMSAWKLHAQQENVQLLTQKTKKKKQCSWTRCVGYIKTDPRSKPKSG